MPATSVPPRLDEWRQIVVAEGNVHLIGYVRGHPRLGDGARAVTSRVLWISADRHWARTESRLYQLGAPGEGPLPAEWASVVDRFLAVAWRTWRLHPH